MLGLTEALALACGCLWLGAAYGYWAQVFARKQDAKRHAAVLAELERHRAMAALAGKRADFIVEKKLTKCPSCAHTTFQMTQCQGSGDCGRASRHQHATCKNCHYEWIVDPT